MLELTDIINALVLLSNFVLIPALSYGSQLAMGALGITLVYGVLRFSNFAHGDLMAFGTMLTILLTWWLQSIGISLGAFPTALLALPFAILGAIALSLIFDKSVYQFYRNQKKLTSHLCHRLYRCDVHDECHCAIDHWPQ